MTLGPAPGQSPAPGRPPARILVVDDDAAVRDAVCEVVAMLGHTAEPAGDGRAALDRFRPGRYDLVVTDLAMPVMNGLQLARRLRALDPTLPITIFSASALPVPSPADVTGLTVARKPDIEGLTRLIQRALERS